MGKVYNMTQDEVRDIGTDIEIILDFLNGLKEYRLPNRVSKLLKRANTNMNNIYKEMSLYNTDEDLYKQPLNI